MNGDWDMIRKAFQALPGGNAESGNPAKFVTDMDIWLSESDSAWKNKLILQKEISKSDEWCPKYGPMSIYRVARSKYGTWHNGNPAKTVWDIENPVSDSDSAWKNLMKPR